MKGLAISYYGISIESWGDGVDSILADHVIELSDVLEELGALGPSTSIGGLAGGVGATFGVNAADPTEAASKASDVFIAACQKLGIPHGGLARIDIVTEPYLERDLAQAPERYVGAAEVAQLFGVSRQRIWELRTTRDDFPAPLAELASGPVWSESSLQTFLAGWNRRSGRPRSRSEAS